jgi:signal transduction histidine kinase
MKEGTEVPGKNTSLWLKVAVILAVFQITATVLIHDRYLLAIVGDVFPSLFVSMVLLLFRSNYRHATGSLRWFWLLNAIGFGLLLCSQLFWLYFDVVVRNSEINPLAGDALSFLTLIPVLAALALRPHSESAARGLRLRRVDFLLLMLWWITLYGYFVLPWLVVAKDSPQYDRANYFLLLGEHLAVIAALAILSWRIAGEWRKFYGGYLVAACIFAGGSFLQGFASARGLYYTGSSYDWFYGFALIGFVAAGQMGANLTPLKLTDERAQGIRRLWAARLAMLALISLPVLAIAGYLYGQAPESVLIFRLRLIFGAFLLLGFFVFFKLHELDRELVRLVNLTESSLESLRIVQTQISQSQKMVALGRLASGAAHEISNPLTAILGYSELLAENSTLTPEGRDCAKGIQQQVHRAQAAVNSMRDLGNPAPPAKYSFLPESNP